MVRRDQNQEEKDIAESILRSQEEEGAIDVDAEEAKSVINVTPRDDEYASTKSHQDGNVTPTEGSVPQSPFQPGSASQATNQAQQAEATQSNEAFTASPLSALERGLLPKASRQKSEGPWKSQEPSSQS